MAVYRFKVAFEDYDAVREIDIRSNQTFEELHYAIHKSIGYKGDYPSSFYVSNDQWHKGQEITIFPSEKKIAAGVTLMEGTKLSRFIDDPHQKFYYIFNFDRPLDFHVELIRIIMEADPKVTYPVCVKMAGEPPKQFLGVSPPPAENDAAEEETDGEEPVEMEDLVMDQDEQEADAEEHRDEYEEADEDEFGFGGDHDEEDEFKKGDDDEY